MIELSGRGTTAATAWTGDDGGRFALAAAVDALADALLPHLHVVEVELMPVIAATLTHREWLSWDRACMLDPRTKEELEIAGNWLLDDLDDERRAITLQTCSTWERLLIVRRYQPRWYRNRRRARTDSEMTSA